MICVCRWQCGEEDAEGWSADDEETGESNLREGTQHSLEVNILHYTQPKRIPIVEHQLGSIYIYTNYFPGHMTNVLCMGSKITSLIGQLIVYGDF